VHGRPANLLPGGHAEGTSTSPYGVTFYNYGPSGAVTFAMASYAAGEGVSLIAPTTGNYPGILFFQDSGNTATAKIFGSSADSTILQGAFYFPTATVDFAYAGAPAYDLLDSKVINFQSIGAGGQTFNKDNFTDNYTSLSNGSPIKGGGVLAE
jgi:hypothetical protein